MLHNRPKGLNRNAVHIRFQSSLRFLRFLRLPRLPRLLHLQYRVEYSLNQDCEKCNIFLFEFRRREAVELADILGYDMIWRRRREVR